MIVIQNVIIQWSKLCRGAPYSTVRNEMKKAFALPATIFDYNRDYGIPYHSIYIMQEKEGYKIQNDKVLFVKDANKIKIDCTEINKTEAGYEVFFRYSGYRGAPTRYDKKNHPLYEKAMDICTSEFGRMIYNGRHTDFDTGEWYYTLCITNIFNCGEQRNDIFVTKEPDKEYQQLAHLY